MNRKELFNECVTCKKRFIGCHSTCESYKKDRKKLDDLNEQIMKNKKQDISYLSYISEKHKRNKNDK